MSNTKNCCKHINGEPEEKEKLFKTEEFLPYHPTQELIFPPELKLSDKYDQQYLIIQGNRYYLSILLLLLILSTTNVAYNSYVGYRLQLSNEL